MRTWAGGMPKKSETDVEKPENATVLIYSRETLCAAFMELYFNFFFTFSIACGQVINVFFYIF